MSAPNQKYTPSDYIGKTYGCQTIIGIGKPVVSEVTGRAMWSFRVRCTHDDGYTHEYERKGSYLCGKIAKNPNYQAHCKNRGHIGTKGNGSNKILAHEYARDAKLWRDLLSNKWL